MSQKPHLPVEDLLRPVLFHDPNVKLISDRNFVFWHQAVESQSVNGTLTCTCSVVRTMMPFWPCLSVAVTSIPPSHQRLSSSLLNLLLWQYCGCGHDGRERMLRPSSYSSSYSSYCTRTAHSRWPQSRS